MHQYSSCVLLFLCCLKSEEQDIELELISTATLWSALQYRSTVLSDWLSVRVGVGGWCVVDGSPLACPVPEAATQHIRLSVSPPVSVFRSALTPPTPTTPQHHHHHPPLSTTEIFLLQPHTSLTSPGGVMAPDVCTAIAYQPSPVSPHMYHSLEK